jgi:hypothetical protein
MYKLPDLPAPDSEIREITDFIELECLKKGSSGLEEIIDAISQLEDNDLTNGNSIDEPVRDRIMEAFNELNNRNKYCNNNYPFELFNEGYVVKIKKDIDPFILVLYSFLIFATRLNMTKKRVHDSIDGTEIFEEISSLVMSKYLGPRSNSFVFGTASENGSFENRINELCTCLNEGGGLKQKYIKSAKPKDDGLDIVNWSAFSDEHIGKLISFGQCKTGTSWERQLSVQPNSFINLWLQEQLHILPLKVFFIAEALERSTKLDRIIIKKESLFFDRCRIMDYYPNVDKKLENNIQSWVKAVKLAHF